MNSLRLVVVCLGLAGCGFTFRTPLDVLIPVGFTGWVRVEYGVASAPAYGTEGGHHVLKIPASGFVRTSSSFEPGYAADSYYYVSPDGSRTKLDQLVRDPRMFTVDRFIEKPRTFGAFFVGSDAAFERAQKDVSALPVP